MSNQAIHLASWQEQHLIGSKAELSKEHNRRHEPETTERGAHSNATFNADGYRFTASQSRNKHMHTLRGAEVVSFADSLPA